MVVVRQIVVFVVSIVSTLSAATLSAKGSAPDGPPHGILLNRLSGKQLKTWLTINSRIYAQSDDGEFLHPELKALFERLQNSGHRIFVEFQATGEGSHHIAGTFGIERLDPEGISHIAVIKLRLENIDRAAAPASSNLNGPFIPFAGLSKADRYTEVFAHEMAHGVDILFDKPRATALDEILRNTDVIVQEQLRRAKGLSDPEAMLEILRRDAFLNELEKPAESAEATVWRELILSSQQRS
jgi:hypothetical protein